MKSYTKRLLALILLLVCTMAMVEFTSNAGIPSIPRKTSVKKASRSSRVAWGTQYDWLSQRHATALTTGAKHGHR